MTLRPLGASGTEKEVAEARLESLSPENVKRPRSHSTRASWRLEQCCPNPTTRHRAANNAEQLAFRRFTAACAISWPVSGGSPAANSSGWPVTARARAINRRVGHDSLRAVLWAPIRVSRALHSLSGPHLHAAACDPIEPQGWHRASLSDKEHASCGLRRCRDLMRFAGEAQPRPPRAARA